MARGERRPRATAREISQRERRHPSHRSALLLVVARYLVERRKHLSRRAGAVAGLLGEQAVDERRVARRAADGGGIELAPAGSLSTARSSAMVVSPRNGRLPVDHLEEHDAEGEEVGARVDRLSRRLLRRHVRQRAEHHALARRELGRLVGRWRLRLEKARQAEVEDLDQALGGQPHVARLQSRGARCRRRARRRGRRRSAARCAAPRPAAADSLAQARPQVAPGNVLEHQVGQPRQHRLAPAAARRRDLGQVDLGLADVQHGGDVGVGERRFGARFAQEAGAAAGIERGGAGEELDRHDALEPRVAGAVDDAHAAPADRLEQLVVTDADRLRQSSASSSLRSRRREFALHL
jgi:hypothetical protein